MQQLHVITLLMATAAERQQHPKAQMGRHVDSTFTTSVIAAVVG